MKISSPKYYKLINSVLKNTTNKNLKEKLIYNPPNENILREVRKSLKTRIPQNLIYKMLEENYSSLNMYITRSNWELGVYKNNTNKE